MRYVLEHRNTQAGVVSESFGEFGIDLGNSGLTLPWDVHTAYFSKGRQFLLVIASHHGTPIAK